MSSVKSINDKMNELETKLTFQEDLLQTLNEIVSRQDKEIQNLWVAKRQLKQSLNEMKDDLSEHPQSEAPPPHY